MFHVLCGYLFSMASNTIDSFDPLNIFELIDFLLTPCFFHHLRVPRRLAWLLPWRDATVRINSEAVMWKITTRGFTLEEVLIMAAMNPLASVAPPPNRFGILLATSLSVRGTKDQKLIQMIGECYGTGD
jgi:hypothetical protein